MNDLLDGALEIASYGDWITPLWAMIQDLRNDGGHTFWIEEACGVSAVEIQWWLEGQGIETWGLMRHGGYIQISMHPDQAAYAQQLMLAAGLPVAYGWV